jgi:hypothetical protein
MENQVIEQPQIDLELLKQQQEMYISYCAMGGVMTSDDGKVTTMPAIKFADQIGVHRNTLRNWKESIPNFAERVRDRRMQLFSLSRESAVYNRLYVIGMTGTDAPAVKALEILAGHFGKLEKPTQRADVKVSGSLAEMLSNAQKIIEGEVVDGSRPAQTL